jgi:recombination protein RecA
MAKKKVDTSESLDDFLQRQYGKDVIQKASNLKLKPRKILKTVLSLDIGLSGGIPDGTVCLLSGKTKAGKSTLCLEMLKNAINDNRPAYYVNIERRQLQQLIKSIEGLDESKLNLIQATSEKILTAEDWLNIIERIVKDVPDAVIVIDSLAAFSSTIEQAEMIGEARDMAGNSKLLASFFRKMQQTIDNNNSILIFISQLMTNRDPHSHKKWIEKGGMSVQYAASVWLTIEYFKVWDKNTETNSPDGQDLICKINSSALGKPYLPCSIPLRYGKGIDGSRDIVSNAENLGFIDKAGAWYTIPSLLNENKEPLKFNGMNAVVQHMTDHPEHRKYLEDEIRKMIFS